MIKRENESVKLEFGTGDICVAGGYIEQEKGYKIGVVIFVNQEPRGIGSPGVIKTGETNLNDYPVVMIFYKKESIDVVIRKLEEARSFMEWQQESC